MAARRVFVAGAEIRVRVVSDHLRNRVEDVEWMLDGGETDAGQIAKRLGVKPGSLDKVLRDAARTDLYLRMTGRPTHPDRRVGAHPRYARDRVAA